MRRMGVWAAAVLLTAVSWLAACVDTSPLDYVPKDTDSGAVVADASIQSACSLCITDESGACAAQYQACEGDTKCAALAACGLDAGCFTVPVLQDRIQCFTPCLMQVGVLAGGDPALQLALELNACALASCSQICGI